MGAHHHLTDNSADAQRATLVGAGVNLALALVKIVVGISGHSAALLADGIHSLSDLASDMLVLMATKHGSQPADDNHPYGHERIETAATVILGIMLLAVAIGIAWDAVERSLKPASLIPPGLLALAIAIISIAANEWLFQYTMNVARRIHSKLLEANAWHHRSDAISSIVVLIGISGAVIGLPVLDAVAAFIVALMIAYIAWQLISNSVKELVDTAIDETTQQQIIDLITDTDGVVSLHMLRTRQMGTNILVDAHLQVHPRLSVSEGHQIAETVEYLLKSRIAHLHDVTIHIDPEDDEEEPLNNHLPLRSKLLTQLESEWSSIPAAAHIRKVNLHYLDGKIEVEILLPLPEEGSNEAREIQQSFQDIVKKHDNVSAIRVLFS